MKILLVLLLTAGALHAAKRREPFAGISSDDLKPGTPEMVERYSGQFYLIPQDYKNDAYVFFLRTQLLQEDRSREPAKALLSLASVRYKPDCASLFDKLGKRKTEEARLVLGNTFYCFDSLLAEDEVIARNPILASDSINWPVMVDAHMGWYAATGDRRPVEKLVRNLAENDMACPCIPWPLSSISRQDSVFESHVRAEALKYPGNQKVEAMLKRIQADKDAHQE